VVFSKAKPAVETEKLNQQVRLTDGRRLGFAEYGDLEGRPVFYFHGWPSSRLEPRTGQTICADMGVRMIAPDRPGYGLSDFKPRRIILDWVADVSELAEHLTLKDFAVLGVSGGGPYAVACAAKIPERLSVALLVCSVAPADAPDATKGMVALNRCLLSFARTAPWLAQCVAGVCLKFFWRKGDQVIPEQIETRLPPADRRALTNAELRRTLTASSTEAFRGGVQAAAADGLLYARPWGFRLQDIRAPVNLWHGEKDVVVPPTMGRYLAATIPGCRAVFYPEDGHFSLAFERLEEILRSARLGT
jgi:pimeloyl-ACP methyl ester carboxylesterase